MREWKRGDLKFGTATRISVHKKETLDLKLLDLDAPQCECSLKKSSMKHMMLHLIKSLLLHVRIVLLRRGLLNVI